MNRKFTLHTVDRFPIVYFKPEHAQGGFAGVWIKEMEFLLARREPFAIISPPSTRSEHRSDLRERSLWMTANRDRLAKLCRGVISVEPDGTQRAKVADAIAAYGITFGVHQLIVDDMAGAEHLAISLLTAPPVL